MTLSSNAIKNFTLSSEFIDANELNRVFRNIEISEENHGSLRISQISANDLYANDLHLSNHIQIVPYDNKGEKIATFTVDGNEIEISAKQIGNNLNIGDNNTIFGSNTIAIGNSNVAFCSNAAIFGISCFTGTRSFRILSGDCHANTWTLDGRNVGKTNLTDGISAGMIYSMRLLNNYDFAGTVLSVIDNTTISVTPYVKRPFRNDENLSDAYLSSSDFYDPSGKAIRGHYGIYRYDGTEPCYTPDYPETDPDDLYDFTADSAANTLWILNAPELGTLSTYSIGNTAEGYNCFASKQYSHAEGANSYASGAYSHAEGNSTSASYAAHSEGRSTAALGENSHAEGFYARAEGHSSHAEGWQTSAVGDRSHAEGYFTAANGIQSHAAGRNCTANGNNSYIWNGDSEYHSSTVNGSFSIYPKNSISGFFIGGQSLNDIIDSKISRSISLIDERLDKIIE